MPIMKPRSSRMVSGSGGSAGSSAMLSGLGGPGDSLLGRGSKSDSGITMGPHGATGAGSGGSGALGSNGVQAGGQRASAAAQAQANQQQLASAAQARKRRSSINVYDQPSSLNSRLRQLETDMLRLDEDRTKLFDDTHSALTQYEIKLGEIHAILKSRQDNVEKYVEEMKMLLQAKEEFEKQTKLLNEKHDRIHEKFMHRETIISREIKLLKNKFELLEKNRQFRSLLSQKSSELTARDDPDLTSGLESGDYLARKRSETGALATLTTLASGEQQLFGDSGLDNGAQEHRTGGASSRRPGAGRKNVRIKLSKLGAISQIFSPIVRFATGKDKSSNQSTLRRKNNKVSSIMLKSSSAVTSANGSTSAAEALAGELSAAPPSASVDAAAGGARDQAATAGSSTPPAGSSSLVSRLFNSKTLNE